jgi:small subunit ribosomal protein S9
LRLLRLPTVTVAGQKVLLPFMATGQRVSTQERAFSSNGSQFKNPPRLRRPNQTAPQTERKEDKIAGYGNRPHAITLFPGDYGDMYDAWEDENEDADDFGDYSAGDDTRELTEELHRQERVRLENKERWKKNSMPPVRVSRIDERGRAFGRGGRKTATARVWIQPGFGNIVVNRKDFVEYFIRLSDREHLMEPLVVTRTCGSFDLHVVVEGGGLTGQAGAARLALANALNAYNPDKYRPVLKRLGLLTRDARIVERKTVGHVKARKSPQWVRR